MKRRKARGASWLWAIVLGLGVISAARCRPSASGRGSSPEQAGESRPLSLSGFAWNLNRGVGDRPDASLAEIERLVTTASQHDVWAFSEVDPDWFAALDVALERATGQNVEGRLGQSGRLQRLALFWRADRLEAVEVNELGRVNVDGYGRAPLAALLRERDTGRETLWVAVHFRRANDEVRAEEATILGDLLAQLGHPTVVLGDANMDCPVDGGACDPAFDRLVANGFLGWVAPSSRLPTSCRRGGDMLDLAFVGGFAATVTVSAQVAPQSSWCSDTMGSGAHVPITIVVDDAHN